PPSSRLPYTTLFRSPPDISAIADYELKYRIILRLALNEPDITYIGSPNPSTFLRLIDLLNEERDMFARSVVTGAFEQLDALDPRSEEHTSELQSRFD